MSIPTKILGSIVEFQSNDESEKILLKPENGKTLCIKGDTQGNLSLSDGSAVNPSLKFTSDTDTGLYRPDNNQLGISTGGNLSASFGLSDIIFNNPFTNNNGYFSVYTPGASTPQSLLNAVDNTINVWITDYQNAKPDTPSFDNITGIFTVTKSGIYQASYSIGIETNATGIRTAAILVNGIFRRGYQTCNPVSSSITSLSSSCTLRLVVGDTLRVNVFQNSGLALNTQNIVPNFFSLYRIG